MPNTICIINIYWGDLPKWFPFYLRCCELNSDIDFLILSDNKIHYDGIGDNIRIKKFTISDFNILASAKTGIPIEIKFPYKVCDFKPAFGNIFSEDLKKYDFWGYCDSDIVFGKLSSYFKQQIENKYDLISGYSDFISGPMCLVRNNAQLNTLYRIGLDYEKIFKSNIYEGFDEVCRKESLRPLTLRKIIILIKFILKNQIRFLFSGPYTLTELKFKLFFYYKRKSMSAPHDFSEIVWYAVKNKLIKVSESDLIFSDAGFERKNLKNWTIRYSKDKLVETNTQMEIPVFHFRLSKNNKEFHVNCKHNTPINFEISATGIKCI